MTTPEAKAQRAAVNEYVTWKYLPLKIAIAAAVALFVADCRVRYDDSPSFEQTRGMIVRESPWTADRDDVLKRIESLERATIQRGAAVENLILEEALSP